MIKLRTIFRFILGFVFLTAFCFAGLKVNGQQPNQDIDEEKLQAEKAWEALVAAKGGREKLHSVNNMLMEMSLKSSKVVDFVTLSVFPEYQWEFEFNRNTQGNWSNKT